MPRAVSHLMWIGIAALGAGAFAVLALKRGETINAAWVLTAALCTYAVGYRFYARFIARRIFALDDARPTPAVRLNDGHDFVPTSKWVVFGHHFAAIAGAGPLVGPILAAQFGFLPGTIWIIVGVVVAGAVQDFVILGASIRRDGKSLGQMAREEIGTTAGWLALLGVFAIIVILIAVLAMVVVNALAESPWGVVSLALTIPIALLMGVWMRWLRPGRVIEASLIGLVLLGLALWAGQWAAQTPWLKTLFTFTSPEEIRSKKARATPIPTDLTAAQVRARTIDKAERLRFNNRLNSGLCAAFLLIILAIMVDTARECIAVLRGRRPMAAGGSAP